MNLREVSYTCVSCCRGWIVFGGTHELGCAFCWSCDIQANVGTSGLAKAPLGLERQRASSPLSAHKSPARTVNWGAHKRPRAIGVAGGMTPQEVRS
jgi:hypothetical protein